MTIKKLHMRLRFTQRVWSWIILTI